MTRSLRAVASALVVLPVIVGATACGQTERDPRPTDDPAAALAPVQLPDVSHLDPGVQQQLRDRQAALQAVLAHPSPSAERAELYGAYGTLLFAAEYRTEAEDAFRAAQTLAPDDMRWPYYLGQLYRVRQEPARAIAMLERALALSPDHVPSLIWLGELHLASGNPAAAEAPLQRALTLSPSSAAALARLGRVAQAHGDHARAIEHLARAVSLEPRASSLHYPLAMSYRALGDTANAQAHLRQAADGEEPVPSDPLMEAVATALQGARPFEARGMEALEARDWNAAVTYLRRAADQAPADAVIRLNLGTALSLAGDAPAAERELREAVRLDPRLARAHFTLGVLAQEAARWDEAIARFTSAVSQDPGFVDARFALAEALRRTGRQAEAVAEYREVMARSPAASQARFGQAMAFVSLGRFREARAVLDEAVRVHPDQPGLPHALARLLAAAPDAGVRDGARALALMQPFVTAEPGPAVAETMGMVMAELGRFDEAVRWQERAIAAAASGGQSALAADMQDNLIRYRARQPCRTPWRATDPVIAVVR